MRVSKDLSPEKVGNCQPFGHIESGARPPDHWVLPVVWSFGSDPAVAEYQERREGGI